MPDPPMPVSITHNPKQCGGAPCVRGLRVRVSDVLDLLASGADVHADVTAELPYVTADDVRACLRYAAERCRAPEATASATT